MGEREEKKPCVAQLVALLKQGFPFRRSLLQTAPSVGDIQAATAWCGVFLSKISLQAECLECILLLGRSLVP